jgi:hypothetical protein
MDSNSKIRTYKAKIEPIIKEIIPENDKELSKIKERLEIIKENYKIIEMIEEKDKFYIPYLAVLSANLKFIKMVMNLFSTDSLVLCIKRCGG